MLQEIIDATGEDQNNVLHRGLRNEHKLQRARKRAIERLVYKEQKRIAADDQ